MNPPLAVLPMYDWPELAEWTDRLWSHLYRGLQQAKIEAPAKLTRTSDLVGIWRSPNLVVGQTCGFPYKSMLADQVHLLGAPDYGLEHCPSGFYRSAWVVRDNDGRTQVSDFANAKFAFNDRHSQSGYRVKGSADFALEVQTGAHRNSIVAVAEGRADIAAIDAVAWRFAQAFVPQSTKLRVLSWSEPTAGLPLICARSKDCVRIRKSLRHSFANLPPEIALGLGIRGFVQLLPSDYGLSVADEVSSG